MIRQFPAIFLLVFITIGILLADQTRLPSWLLLTAAVPAVAAGLALFSRQRQMWATVCFGITVLSFSAFHFTLRYLQPGPSNVASVVRQDTRYRIFGYVSDWPDIKAERTEIRITVDSIRAERTRRVTGSILVRVSDTTTVLQRGDRVDFSGRIYPVTGRGFSSTFDYRRYLNLKGVFGIVYLPTLLDVRVDKANRYALVPQVDRLRSAIREAMYADLTPVGAALASGFLIGETRNIPTQVYHHFRDSGTLHLLAVSGSNVALVILFFVVALRPLSLSPVRRSLVLMAATALFALLSYGEPSVLRASLMAVLIITAGLLRRRYNLNNIIAAAAAIILLFDPAQLFDVGFQLSFAIAWSLIFVTPRVHARFRPVQNRWWYRWLVFPLMISLIAQVASTGLIAYHFGRIPIISPAANLVIVPLVSAAVVGVLVMLAGHLVLPLLGALIGSLLNPLLSLILHLVNVMGGEHVPVAQLASVPVWMPVLFYLFLVGGVVAITSRRMRRVIIVALLIAVNAVAVVGVIELHTARTTVKVSLFRMPGGVAAVVERPGGRSPDLIITGAGARPYPLEEKVINPCLTTLDVGNVNDMFVLSADYQAIDDLLRLAAARSASRIFVHDRLKNSFGDVIAAYSMDTTGLSLTAFGGRMYDLISTDCHYRASDAGVSLCLGETAVDFCECPGREMVDSTDDRTHILVAGSLWRTTPDELVRLSSRGVDRIFCSIIIQQEEAGAGGDSERPSDNLPAVHDLSRLGPITLEIPVE